MSGLVGKKSSTLKKEQVKESKLLATGVKAIKFWHEAQADGEASIPFGSLSLPASILAQGLTNPTSTEILAANLALFHTNVEVHSSLNQKLMEGLTYVVKNNEIKFVNGYESTEGEIFAVVYKNDVITGTNVVDARPLTATGVLTAGDTDFNVGEAFKTNAYPGTQLGEVLVFVDGEVQFRNSGNATAGPGNDGNYEEVHSSNGFGTIIRFNEDFPADKNIIVISRNLIAERPDISMMQLIEKLGGQLDEVIEYVAALAGVDESEFYVAPNQIDLKAFGDAVIQNKQNITSILNKEVDTIIEEVITYTGFISKNGSNEVKFKNLTQDNGVSLISDNNSGDHTIITALDSCNVKVSSGGTGAGTTGFMKIQRYDSSDVLVNEIAFSQGGSGALGSAYVGSLSAGDYLVVWNSITPNDSNQTNFSVIATKITKKKISEL